VDNLFFKSFFDLDRNGMNEPRSDLHMARAILSFYDCLTFIVSLASPPRVAVERSLTPLVRHLLVHPIHIVGWGPTTKGWGILKLPWRYPSIRANAVGYAYQ